MSPRVALGSTRRAGPATTITLFAVALAAAVFIAGCTGNAGPDTRTSGADHGPGALPITMSSQGSFPTADLSAIKAAVTAINATAGGPVGTQRSVLQRLAAPGQAATQRACPAAHSTLSFQPAYRDLRHAPPDVADTAAPNPPSPTSRPGSGAATGDTPTARSGGASIGTSASGGAGTAYLLPAFINVYTGDRITGTDLTTLRLWVFDGTARIAALCVS